MARRVDGRRGKAVVKGKAEPGEDRAALARGRGCAEKRRQRRAQSAEPGKDRKHHRQHVDEMRRVLQEAVALAGGLSRAGEIADLQLGEPALDQPRAGRAGAAAEIAAIDDQAADALCAEIAEEPGAVHPGAENDDIHGIAFDEGRQVEGERSVEIVRSIGRVDRKVRGIHSCVRSPCAARARPAAPQSTGP